MPFWGCGCMDITSVRGRKFYAKPVADEWLMSMCSQSRLCESWYCWQVYWCSLWFSFFEQCLMTEYGPSTNQIYKYYVNSWISGHTRPKESQVNNAVNMRCNHYQKLKTELHHQKWSEINLERTHQMIRATSWYAAQLFGGSRVRSRLISEEVPMHNSRLGAFVYSSHIMDVNRPTTVLSSTADR